jgi:hypothetical protein
MCLILKCASNDENEDITTKNEDITTKMRILRPK